MLISTRMPFWILFFWDPLSEEIPTWGILAGKTQGVLKQMSIMLMGPQDRVLEMHKSMFLSLEIPMSLLR